MTAEVRPSKLGHHDEASDFILGTRHDEKLHLQVTTGKTQEMHGGCRQKREALEHEVATLQKMLHDEEKLSQVLKHSFHRSIGSLPCLPEPIPNETKELLSEIATVEDSIANLEGEINHLHRSLNQERHSKELLNYHQCQLNNTNTVNGSRRFITTFPCGTISVLQDDTFPSYQLDATHRRTHAFIGSVSEADSLFIPSKASILGSPLSRFGNKEAHGGQPTSFSHRRQSPQRSNKPSYNDGFQEKCVKTTCAKASQSKMPREHHDPKIDDRKTNNIFQKPRFTITRLQDKTLTSLPNKLSEEIMKCLMCMFLRIHRTSRTTKYNKSAYFPGSSSFPTFLKAETCCSSKDVGCQIDLSRKDPFGILDLEESISRDIGSYKNFVIINSSTFLLSNLSNCSTLLEQLRILFSKLCKVELRSLTYKQKLAFWINLYNACVMHAYLRNGIPSNFEKLIALMEKGELNIGDKVVNALMIEHDILGQPTESENADVCKKVEDDMRTCATKTYKLENREPNLSFALSRGFRSSPAVRIYTSQDVCMQLERSKLEYLQASIVVTRNKNLMIPNLLHQYMSDCSTNIDVLINWICSQLPVSCSLRKSIIHCINAHPNEPISSFAEVMPYQPDFQYLLVA